MATKQEFKTYMEQNKANLNQEALKGADMNMVYNEWRDTGSISKNYFNQPVTQQPNTQVTPQVQPRVEQQIPQKVEQQQLQTPFSKTQPGGTPMTQDNITTNKLVDEGKLPESQREIYPQKEVKPGEVSTLETPKYQQQIDKFLEGNDFANARNKLKEGLANGTIDKATFDKSESYIWGKIQEQSQVGRDENAMFNALKTGQKIQSQFTNTPEAKKAQSRFDVANRYSSMSEEQLYNAYLNGEIGSQLEKDIADNPYLSIAKERFNKKLVTDNINKEANNILNAYNKGIGKDIVKKEEKTALETINDRMLTMFENMGKSENEILDFKSYMAQNYPDLVNETKELNAKNMQLKNLVDERDARLDEIIRENPGISINRATMLASRENAPINKQIQSMSYEIANLSANIQYQTSMADKEFGYALQQQSRQDQLAQEQRGYMFDFLKGEQSYQRGLEAEARQREYQMEDRQYQEELQQRQLEQKYAYEYGDLNSNNATLQNIAIERAVASMYENYPIPGMESQATKVQKVKNLMAQGMTGTQAIAQVENEIRNSQRYKDYLASEKAKITPKTETKFGFQNVGDGTIAVTDTSTGKVTFVNSQGQPTSGLGDLRNLASQFPGQAWAKNNNPAGITWNANFDAGTGTAALLKEAGINFSKGTSRPASEGGNYVTFDTMEDGLKAQRIIMSQTYGNLTVGDMLKKWVGTSEGANYAKQVAGMAGIDINTKVSDLADSELTTLQLAKIQKESPGLYGILIQPEAGPTDAGSGAPIAYARRIKSMVPATLMNSEVELAQLNNTIGELYKKGVSAEDAVLTYLGVEFNPEVKDLGINLIDKVRGLELDPSYYSSMTDLLNKGKIDQAVRKTENLAIKEAQKLNPDLKFSEGGTTFAVKQANNILDLVNQYESKFGTITGKWENLTKGFFGDKEAQELATKITQAISKTRNDLVGSNITAGEQGAIGELIPKLDESAETAKVKLNNLKNSPLLQYNQARASVGLPELDENSLLNINNRINLYKGITSTTQGGGRVKGATKGRIK